MKPAIDFASLNFSWASILPLLVISGGSLLILLLGVNIDEEDSEGLGWLSIAVLSLAFIVTLGLFGREETTFGGAIILDDYTLYFYLALELVAAITILMSLEYVREIQLPGAEYYSLVLFATLGMMLMATAGDLIVIFLGLETMSIAVYVLAGLARSEVKSSEAALKYFLLGAFSTGFLLYGIALTYGATGTIKLDGIATPLSGAASSNPMLLLGIAMLLIGFGFKVAAVPFHMWTPDVYEGAPTSVTAFMAAGVKLAGFAGFVRVFVAHLGSLHQQWWPVLWVIAALTMTAGNLIAIVQRNIKRMLAYSAIAHAGYLLVAMTASNTAAGGAILYYLLGYALTNLGAFAVIIAVGKRGEPNDTIADLRGLSERHPVLSAAMALFLLSLTGVPPLAGFVGKFYIFSAVLNAGYLWLVIIAVLNSVISAYYYISVIVSMYMDEGGAEPSGLASHPALVAAISIAAIATILIGIYPQPYLTSAANAFASATGGTPVRAAMRLP